MLAIDYDRYHILKHCPLEVNGRKYMFLGYFKCGTKCNILGYFHNIQKCDYQISRGCPLALTGQIKKFGILKYFQKLWKRLCLAKHVQ